MGGYWSFSAPREPFWMSSGIFNTYFSRAIDSAYFFGDFVYTFALLNPNRVTVSTQWLSSQCPNVTISDAKSDPRPRGRLGAVLGAEAVKRAQIENTGPGEVQPSVFVVFEVALQCVC